MPGRPVRLVADTELAGHASLASGLPNPADTTDQHGVEGEGFRGVHDAIEELVIASGGESEPLADRPLLGHLELPALTLEFQDGPGALVQWGGGGRGAHERSVSTLEASASTVNREFPP